MANKTTWKNISEETKKLTSQSTAQAGIDANATAAKKDLDALSAKNQTQAKALYNQAENELNKSIKGGMSETTKSKLGVAYSAASAKNANALATAKGAVDTTRAQNAYTTKAAAIKTQGKLDTNLNLAKRARADKLANEKANRKLDKQKETMNIWKDTVGRFDTKKKAANAIKRLKNSKDPLRAKKIAYIRNQMFKLDQQERDKKLKDDLAKASGSGRRGGGGGGRRYGGGYRRWGYGGGSGSSDGAIEYEGNNAGAVTSGNDGPMGKRGNYDGSLKGNAGGSSKGKASKVKEVLAKALKDRKKGSRPGKRNRSNVSRHWHL